MRATENPARSEWPEPHHLIGIPTTHLELTREFAEQTAKAIHGWLEEMS